MVISLEFLTNRKVVTKELATLEATHEKVTCEAYDWKLKSHTRLSSSRVFREKGYPAKYSQNFLFGKKLKLFYQILYLHYKYPHYP